MDFSGDGIPKMKILAVTRAQQRNLLLGICDIRSMRVESSEQGIRVLRNKADCGNCLDGGRRRYVRRS